MSRDMVPHLSSYFILNNDFAGSNCLLFARERKCPRETVLPDLACTMHINFVNLTYLGEQSRANNPKLPNMRLY